MPSAPSRFEVEHLHRLMIQASAEAARLEGRLGEAQTAGGLWPLLRHWHEAAGALDQAVNHQPMLMRIDRGYPGVMAFEMLSGQVPFEGRTPRELLTAQLTLPPPPLEQLRPEIPVVGLRGEPGSRGLPPCRIQIRQRFPISTTRCGDVRPDAGRQRMSKPAGEG